MKAYTIYNKKLADVEILKETKCFYYLQDCIAEFGFCTRIEKEDVMLTPQEAIEHFLNSKRTYLSAIKERAIEVEKDIEALEQLQNEYGTP